MTKRQSVPFTHAAGGRTGALFPRRIANRKTLRLTAPTAWTQILDGIVDVIVDGEVIAESGPGSIIGERAALESGVRTSTVRAMTPVRVPRLRLPR